MVKHRVIHEVGDFTYVTLDAWSPPAMVAHWTFILLERPLTGMPSMDARKLRLTAYENY
jgi:hypothetical protein